MRPITFHGHRDPLSLGTSEWVGASFLTRKSCDVFWMQQVLQMDIPLTENFVLLETLHIQKRKGLMSLLNVVIFSNITTINGEHQKFSIQVTPWDTKNMGFFTWMTGLSSTHELLRLHASSSFSRDLWLGGRIWSGMSSGFNGATLALPSINIPGCGNPWWNFITECCTPCQQLPSPTPDWNCSSASNYCERKTNSLPCTSGIVISIKLLWKKDSDFTPSLLMHSIV